MQIPGLLVEYLISGSVALIWLLPLLSILGYSLPKEAPLITLFVPGIYVLGLIVDFMGGFMTRSYKNRLHDKVYTAYHITVDKYRKEESHALEIQGLLYAPELMKAFEMRRSRARIARSTIVNMVFITIILTIFSWQIGKTFAPVITGIVGIFLTLISFAMWTRVQRLDYQFTIESITTLEEKLKAEKES